MYPIHLVVRKSMIDGTHHCGPASKLPLTRYEHVASFGYWYGSQMSYRPYRDTVEEGCELAARLDGLEEGASEQDAL